MACKSDNDPAVQEWRQSLADRKRAWEERIRKLYEAIQHAEKELQKKAS